MTIRIYLDYVKEKNTEILKREIEKLTITKIPVSSLEIYKYSLNFHFTKRYIIEVIKKLLKNLINKHSLIFK
jgi:hypothetical protein